MLSSVWVSTIPVTANYAFFSCLPNKLSQTLSFSSKASVPIKMKAVEGTRCQGTSAVQLGYTRQCTFGDLAKESTSFSCSCCCTLIPDSCTLNLLKRFCIFSCSMFRQGMHDLKVWPNVEADGSEPTKTPGRTSSTISEDQMSRLAKVME